MKKIKNLVIGGIQQKIFNLVLFTIILMMMAYTAVIIYQTNNLTNTVRDTIEKQEETVSEMTSAIDDTALGDMFEEKYNQVLEDTYASVTDSIARSRRTIIILLVIVLIMALTGALVLAKRIVKPLETITRRVGELSETNLEFKMEDAFRTDDEIQVLAESFAALSHKTVEYVGEVKRVTAEKERISTELDVASQIQEGMIPHIYPAFPERSEFDIYASMHPAKEVGGDFYDFFLIDDDHLAVVMADVSGKGIPAALFMMASKILINNVSRFEQSSPAKILENVNNQICESNEAEMFVTVWLGILEISTGILKAANAGHEYPVVKRNGGGFELYKDKHGFVIGGMDGTVYTEYQIELQPGDMVFQYTDGVTEAADCNEQLFGTERMIEVLNDNPEAAPEEVLVNMGSAIEEFVNNAPQFDDITMLCLKYIGK